jgi:hypothetical protein
MTLDPETTRVLRRLTELQALINHLGDDTEEETYQEYHRLAEPMVQEFLPLVRKLVQAGLLTLDLPEPAFSQTKGFNAAAFNVEDAFDNGSIWLVAGELMQGSPIPDHSKN